MGTKILKGLIVLGVVVSAWYGYSAVKSRFFSTPAESVESKDSAENTKDSSEAQAEALKEADLIDPYPSAAPTEEISTTQSAPEPATPPPVVPKDHSQNGTAQGDEEVLVKEFVGALKPQMAEAMKSEEEAQFLFEEFETCLSEDTSDTPASIQSVCLSHAKTLVAKYPNLQTRFDAMVGGLDSDMRKQAEN